MADQRIRDLEREALAGGGDEGVRFVQVALRRGELSRAQVALLAAAGNAAAAEALEIPHEEPHFDSPWLGHLATLGGRQALVAVGVGCARSALPFAEGEQATRGAALLKAVEAWLAGAAGERLEDGALEVSAALQRWNALGPWARTRAAGVSPPPLTIKALERVGRAALATGPLVASGSSDEVASWAASLRELGVWTQAQPVEGLGARGPARPCALYFLSANSVAGAVEALGEVLGLRPRDARALVAKHAPTPLELVREALFLTQSLPGQRAEVLDSLKDWTLRGPGL